MINRLENEDKEVETAEPTLSIAGPATSDEPEAPSPDEDEEADEASPPITERDIRMIVAALHDEGRGHVIPDMIESVTGVRPPDGTYTPKRMPIRDPQWREARKKIKLKKARIARKARMTEQEKTKEIARLENWKAANPDKMEAATERRLENKKASRKTRPFVAVDLEGFDTGRYFTDDRKDYVREKNEGVARGDWTEKECEEYLTHVLVREEDRWNPPFNGWTVHDRQWYLDQHNLTADDPFPSVLNKKPRTPPIYIEHRPFLFGAGNDHDRYFLTADEDQNGIQKTALTGEALLNAIVYLQYRFKSSSAAREAVLSGAVSVLAAIIGFARCPVGRLPNSLICVYVCVRSDFTEVVRKPIPHMCVLLVRLPLFSS